MTQKVPNSKIWTFLYFVQFLCILFYFIVTKSSGSIPISIWFLLSVTLFCSQCRRKTCQLAGVISCCPQINPLFPYNSSEKFMNIIQNWPKCPDSAYQLKCSEEYSLLNCRLHFTLILGYELCSLLKNIWMWNIEQQ